MPASKLVPKRKMAHDVFDLGHAGTPANIGGIPIREGVHIEILTEDLKLPAGRGLRLDNAVEALDDPVPRISLSQIQQVTIVCISTRGSNQPVSVVLVQIGARHHPFGLAPQQRLHVVPRRLAERGAKPFGKRFGSGNQSPTP